MNYPKQWLVKFLVWRLKHISNKNFLLILSVIIGAIAGLAAVVLKQTVHFIQNLLEKDQGFTFSNYFYLAYPLIGIILTVVLSRYLMREKLGHGISDILFTISKKSSIVKRSKMYNRMITSSLTVGFGGSVGLEAPIVVTGSAIGSNIGRLVHLNYKRRTLLIGCGSAGAIAGIFNSPIAGVIFSIEVMLAEVNISAFIPLLIASVAGSLVSLSLLGDDILFSFKMAEPFVTADTPYYLLLGVLCGMVSLYFTRLMYVVENWIYHFSSNYLIRGITGGILVGLIIFLFPPIYGEGYDTIKAMLNGNDVAILNNNMFFRDPSQLHFLILFLVGIILVKPAATALTIGSGGSGGVFAPSLFIGGVTGYAFALLINQLSTTQLVSLSNFTLVGMCGVMSGILHAPLTAIFLIAEITSGYTLFVPLMLVSAISYSTISYFEKYSIYTKHLVEKGDLIQDDRDKQVLSLIDLKKIIEKDLLPIHPNAKLDDLVSLFRQAKRNIFPVVDENGIFEGIVDLDDIRDIMFDQNARENVLIREIMHNSPSSVSSFETMPSVMKKFQDTGAWNLPVIDNGKYVGFISKSKIFNAYRTKLMRQNLE
jgi:CIC family chloride channel protein